MRCRRHAARYDVSRRSTYPDDGLIRGQQVRPNIVEGEVRNRHRNGPLLLVGTPDRNDCSQNVREIIRLNVKCVDVRDTTKPGMPSEVVRCD